MKKILVQALKRKVDICKANTNKKVNTFSLILHSALLFYLVTDSIQYLLKTFLKFCTNIKFQMEGTHHLLYFFTKENISSQQTKFYHAKYLQMGENSLVGNKEVSNRALAQHTQSSGCQHLHNCKKKYTPQPLNISVQADAPTILCPSISVEVHMLDPLDAILKEVTVFFTSVFSDLEKADVR